MNWANLENNHNDTVQYLIDENKRLSEESRMDCAEIRRLQHENDFLQEQINLTKPRHIREGIDDWGNPRRY